MTEAGLFFEIFKMLRENPDVARRLGLFNPQSDEAVAEITSCKVDEEWLLAIERGLDFVGKALEEERRFIRSEGEVLPIEKVKRVSKESVRHLARHSDYINAERVEDDIVPEKLYTVERLNDYATYENRFLYMLLTVTDDFLARKIGLIEKNDAFKGSVKSKKTVLTESGRIDIDINVTDYAYNYGNNDALKRAEQLRSRVSFYLRSPLMEEIGKADKLNTVTMTNVLRMDKNFSEAVALYDFITSYDKDGFETEVLKRENSAEASEEAAFAMMLLSSVLREKLEKTGEKEYREETERLIAETREVSQTEIPENLANYILSLQKRLSESAETEKIAEKLRRENQDSQEKIIALQKTIAERDEEIAALKEKNRADGESFRKEKAQYLQESAEKLASERADFARKIEEKDKIIEKLEDEKEKSAEQNAFLSARLRALRSDSGLKEESDLSDEELFAELEKQYEALGKTVRSDWKGVKKMMRKEFYSELRTRLFGNKAGGKR